VDESESPEQQYVPQTPKAANHQQQHQYNVKQQMYANGTTTSQINYRKVAAGLVL
jgi:hypothetical protein